MKEASGELNLTLITIVAIGIIAAFFGVFWPKIQESIEQQWDNSTNINTTVGYIVTDSNN